MKKVLSVAVALLFAGAVMAQTIVSTSPSNKNAILEEFTGVNCGYCPDGHRMANEACAAHPDHAWAINIHTGSFAARYFTQWGAAIASQSNLNGYPAGTVNRHNFGNGQNGGTAMSRSGFASSVNTICNTPSPVNVAAEGEVVGRTLTLHIEVYYTGDAANPTNLLNVAMLQNNIIGPQGGASYNPDYVVGSQYRHMHMLRDMLTGQWGVSIPATAGTFFDTTIYYDIPMSITGTENGNSSTVQIGDNLADLEFIVFVAEGHQEILTGVKANVALEDPVMSSNVTVEHNSTCALEYQPVVTVTNNTLRTIYGITFDYDGQTVTSGKTLNPFEADTFHMPVYTVTLTGENNQNCATTKSITFVSYNDQSDATTLFPTTSPVSFTMADFSVYNVESPLTVTFKLDQYGEEASIDLKQQANCNAIFEKSYGTGDRNKTKVYSLSPVDPGYYVFSVYDSYGDGMASNAKGVSIADANGTTFWQAKGNYGSQADCWMNITNAGTGEMAIDNASMVKFSVYPNPVVDRLSIECSEQISHIDIMDVAGRTVMSLDGNHNNVSTQALGAGVYMLRVVTEQGTSTRKFVKE